LPNFVQEVHFFKTSGAYVRFIRFAYKIMICTLYT